MALADVCGLSFTNHGSIPSPFESSPYGLSLGKDFLNAPAFEIPNNFDVSIELYLESTIVFPLNVVNSALSFASHTHRTQSDSSIYFNYLAFIQSCCSFSRKYYALKMAIWSIRMNCCLNKKLIPLLSSHTTRLSKKSA